MKSTWSVLVLAGCAGMAAAAPDVIVGDLPNITVYNTTTARDTTALAVGTTSCNIGDTRLAWFAAPSNLHPVIGQNMFRYRVVGGAGRFEQVGQSFLKHGFTALSQSLCSPCNDPTNGTELGVGCSDPYSSSLNGSQTRLGPRSQVNPSTGVYPTSWNNSTNLPMPQYAIPSSATDPDGNRLARRLQVRKADLFPAQNGGATYFVDGQYVTQDDAAAGKGWNSASYRRATVSHAVSSGTDSFTIGLTGTTKRQMPGIEAWREMDSAVTIVNTPFTNPGSSAVIDPTVTVPYTKVSGDGTVILGYKVTSLGGGLWDYEYAVHNLTLDRSVGSFSVPMGDCASATGVGFHDVFAHSGEPYSDADWTSVKSTTALTWSTEGFATNPNANAIRWGTMYNFRFVSDRAPVSGSVALGMFKPGTPDGVSIAALVPEPCPVGSCVADVDDGTGTGTPDGGVTIDDLVYYLAVYDAGSLEADVDDGTGTGTTDGGVTIDDLIYFLERFDLGC